MNNVFTIKKSPVTLMHYIELNDALVKRLTKGGNKRVICTINNKVDIHAAILKTKEGMHYVTIGLKHLKAIGLKGNSRVNASFKIDTTELQFSIPEEFAEVIATDENAKKVFDGLTDGNKRGLIALVNMVKSSNKKIERSLLIAEKLKAGITSPQKAVERKHSDIK
jgi:uncharacterized protein YdeI (YjbR/CyaY-like superfamily)